MARFARSREAIVGDGFQLAAHIAGSTRFFTLLKVPPSAASANDADAQVSFVGRGLPTPKLARSFPPFLFHRGKTRDGRVVFGIWDGGERAAGQVVGLLTEAQLRMNIAQAFVHAESLAEAIEEGETPTRQLLVWYPD